MKIYEAVPPWIDDEDREPEDGHYFATKGGAVEAVRLWAANSSRRDPAGYVSEIEMTDMTPRDLVVAVANARGWVHRHRTVYEKKGELA